MVNKAMIIGRLGKDPELKYTQSGSAVCNFSVATSDNWTDKDGNKQEDTQWHRIVIYGNQAESCNQYLLKGKQVYVEGKIKTRDWENKEGKKVYTTEIIANSVKFLGQRESVANNTNQEAFDIPENTNFTNDDIPF